MNPEYEVHVFCIFPGLATMNATSHNSESKDILNHLHQVVWTAQCSVW